MAKKNHHRHHSSQTKIVIKPSKDNQFSQILIGATVLVILAAAYETISRNYFTQVAPTQLYLLAGVLGILGLYLQHEK